MNAAATYKIDSFLLPISSKFDFHCVQGHNKTRIDPLRPPVVHTQPPDQIKVKNDCGFTTENITHHNVQIQNPTPKKGSGLKFTVAMDKYKLGELH